jgi:hypothetical protein
MHPLLARSKHDFEHAVLSETEHTPCCIEEHVDPSHVDRLCAFQHPSRMAMVMGRPGRWSSVDETTFSRR